MKLVTEYPEFWEIYQEIAKFAKKPEALMDIFSEELRIMDRNTERKGEITELKDTISEKDKLIARLQAQLNSTDSVQTAQKRD